MGIAGLLTFKDRLVESVHWIDVIQDGQQRPPSWWQLAFGRKKRSKDIITQLNDYYLLLGGSALFSSECFKLRGLSPHANYTDRAAAAGRRS